MIVREARPDDAAEWARMRNLLMPSDDHPGEIAEFFARGWTSPTAVFVLDRGDGTLAGFVEAGTRPYAEGCDTTPVGYLEMWWIDEDVRRRGHGASLVRVAEEWARSQGCREMASDTQLDNDRSFAAHRALGYEEVERIICFRRTL
ncbi:MAG TPA: GNAT family N-acetyltransferase [Thermoanaerobaculia bacterium]